MKLFKSKKLKNLRPTAEVCHADSVMNASDTLFANIRFSSVDDPVKTITITSAAPNDGKTTVAYALALAICKTGRSCILVEGDMRRRSLRQALAVKAPHGIYSVLSREVELKDAIVVTNDEGLSFLDAEAGIPNPEELLNSRRYGEVLGELRDMFDYVIVDTPPVGAFADASLVSTKTDGTVLVVREDYTEKYEAVHAAEQLKTAGARILGVALNGQSGSSAGGYGYYYGYYYEEKQVPADSVK